MHISMHSGQCHANHTEYRRSLFEEAVRLTGVKEKTALLRESLKALIQRESARRLAKLGGSEPELKEIPRRHSSS